MTRWQPWACGLLAAGAGFLSIGAAGLAVGLAGPLLAMLSRPSRIVALLPLALVPLPPLGPAVGWEAAGLLLGAAVAAGLDMAPPDRGAAVALAVLAGLLVLGAAAIPRLESFFAADPGLAAFFAAGAAVASLGAGVALVQGRTQAMR